MRTNNIQHNTLVFWNSCSQAIDQVCCETWMWSERVLPFVCQKFSTDTRSSMSYLVLEYIDMYWCWSWLKRTCSTWLYNIIYNWTLSHVIDVERNNSTFHIDWTYGHWTLPELLILLEPTKTVFLWNEYRNFKWVPLKSYSWQPHTQNYNSQLTNFFTLKIIKQLCHGSCHDFMQSLHSAA